MRVMEPMEGGGGWMGGWWISGVCGGGEADAGDGACPMRGGWMDGWMDGWMGG